MGSCWLAWTRVAKQEGIHLGATAETIDILHRCYSGMELHEPINVDISASPGPDRMIYIPLGAEAARASGSG